MSPLRPDWFRILAGSESPHYLKFKTVPPPIGRGFKSLSPLTHSLTTVHFQRPRSPRDLVTKLVAYQLIVIIFTAECNNFWTMSRQLFCKTCRHKPPTGKNCANGVTTSSASLSNDVDSTQKLDLILGTFDLDANFASLGDRDDYLVHKRLVRVAISSRILRATLTLHPGLLRWATCVNCRLSSVKWTPARVTLVL